MRSDLYTFSAPVFVRHLNILSEILLIAEKHTTSTILRQLRSSRRTLSRYVPLTGQVAQPVIRLGARLLAYLARSPHPPRMRTRRLGNAGTYSKGVSLCRGIPQTRSGAQSYA